MSYRIFSSLCCAAMLLALLTTAANIASAQLPMPVLTSVFPPGAKSGTPSEVTVAGANLDDAEKLVFSHPGITAAPKMQAPSELFPNPTPIAGQFVVTAAADVPTGIYEVRHVGRYGASNPRAFAVSNLAETVKQGDIKSREKAQEIAENSVVSGRVEANNYDYYVVSLKAGKRIVFDCLAQRLDSKLNGTLVLFDAAGREVARVLDTEGFDPVLDFTPPADGKYVVCIYDFTFGGGADHFYRLQITGAPYIDFIFPPAGQPGSNASYTLYGRNLPGGQPAEGLFVGGRPLEQVTVNIAVPADENVWSQAAVVGIAAPRTVLLDSVEYRLASPQGNSNTVALGVSQGPVTVEQEPNNLPAQAMKITVPTEVCGRFYPQRDADWVQFEAKKGEVYVLELVSHRLGRNSDPMLLVQRVTKNEKGEEQVSDVAQVDDPQDRNNRIGGDFDTSTDDPSYKLTVPDDGVYRVMVRDQFGDSRRDPRYVYRLIIRKPEPDFRLSVYPDVPNAAKNDQASGVDPFVLRKGGSTMLRLNVDRRDEFQGEIAVSVEGLPAGVYTHGALLDGNVSSGVLVISATDTAAAGMGPIRVVAKAKIGDREKVRTARVGTGIWGTTNKQQEAPKFRAARDLLLVVSDKETDPLSLFAGDDKVLETALGGKLEIPIKVQRRGEMKDPLKITAVGLPNDIKPKDLNIANGVGEGKLEIEFGQQNVKAGAYTFCLRADSKISYAKNPQSVAIGEAEQKRIQEATAALNEKLKQAKAAKEQTAKTAKDAAELVKATEQKKNVAAAEVQQKKDAEKQAAEAKLAEIDKALVESQAKAKEAEDARVMAEQEANDAEAKVKFAEEMKKQGDAKLAELKKQAQAKDLQVSFVSTPVKIRLHAAPIKVEAPAPTAPVKAGSKGELTLNVARMFNFNDEVKVSIDPLPGGWSSQAASIPAGQASGKLEFTPPKNLAAGDHSVTLKVKGKFGNVNFETSVPAVVKVEAAAP